jgi:signal transduction histidine kinase
MHIQRAGCDADFTGKLVDVSYPVVGMRLACSQKIPANSDLQLRVAAGKNKEALTLGGMAVWCLRKESEAHSQNPIYHVGIELKAATTENQQKLEAEVADLLPEWVPHQYRSLYERAAGMDIEYTEEIDRFITPWIEQNYRLNVLIESMHQINSTLKQDLLLTRIMEAARQVVNSEASSLMMLDDQTQELTIHIPTGPVKGKISGKKVPPGQGIAGWVALHNQPLILEDAKNDPRHYTGIDTESGFETRSLICVPLKNSDGEVIGVLEALNRRGGTTYTSQDLNIFLAFTAQAAIALENAQLHENLQQAYDQLKATQEQVVQQERLKALGTMASGVVHDFNNMLTGMLGGASLLIRDKTLTEQQQRYVQIFNNAAQDAAQVVVRLREFYRPSDTSTDFSAVQLNELVEQSISMTKPRWQDMQQISGDAIQIHIDLDKNQPVISGSVSELRDAMTNLIFNAADAMPHGGTLTLRTCTVPDHVIFEISDTGIGMSEEIRARCLEPFFSTKGEKGTGLGLSMVYGTVQRHNGSLHVESEIGHGTIIRIKLPITNQEVEQAVSVAAPPVLRPLSVLAIDDKQSVREILRELLECDGHTVVLAATGREGLVKYLTGRFDLIITDQGMPGMNGTQLARHIKEINPDQPIILLTGWTRSIEEKEQAESIDLVVKKPITLEILQNALRQVIRE